MINKNRVESEHAVCHVEGELGRGWCLLVDVLEVVLLWADMVDSWIASCGLDGFTPSEEHRTLLPVKTLTIGLPQIHISCRFIRRANNLGAMWCLKWGGLTPECP